MILDNIKKVRDRIRQAAERSGRDPRSVRLVAVTKYASPEAVRELIATGLVAEIGENRVQDALAKKKALGPEAEKVRWRMIGHLQTNKAGKAVRSFDAVDSLDSPRLAEALDRAMEGRSQRLPVLLQVKLTTRAAQSGVSPEELPALLKTVAGCARLSPMGLMGIAPLAEEPEAARPAFRRLRALFEEHFGRRPEAQLSMGMSRDFEIAVEEGATHVRIGSTIFS